MNNGKGFTRCDARNEAEENEAKACDESEIDEAKIREAVRSELESMWASGQVFGKKSKSRRGEVTMGFSGIGFKK
mgnify:CR=1 FL=1